MLEETVGRKKELVRTAAPPPQSSTPEPTTVKPVHEPTGASTAAEGIVESQKSLPELPAEMLLEGIPLGMQERNLSCELQSASDLAWYYGKPYTWKELFLRVGHDPGGNPHKGFVGRSLDDCPGLLYPNGYGVYAEPIAMALRQLGLPAEVHYRKSAAWLREQIALRRPVMVWATGGMVERPVEEWVASDGAVVEGVRGEHTFLVIGYSPDGGRSFREA